MSPTATKQTATVLVVGAGYVGRRFMERQPVDSVIGLNRSAVASPLRIVEFDLDTGGALPVELQQPYKVLYTVPPSGSQPDERLSLLLQMLKPAPGRFVYLSTTGVYGDRGGARVDESAPVNPGNARAAARVGAELLLQDWGSRHTVGVVILRVPGIYGPTRLGHHSIRSGQPVIAENESGPGNRIHVDDLVSCCEAAMEERVGAGIYNVGDGDHRSATWFKQELARQLGLPSPRLVSMDEATRILSPMALSFLREKRIVDTSRMRQILGVTPSYPDAVEGIAASLEEERR